MNRFRKEYRELSPAETARVDSVKDSAEMLAQMIETGGESRLNSLALTHLEIAVMFATKAITD